MDWLRTEQEIWKDGRMDWQARSGRALFIESGPHRTIFKPFPTPHRVKSPRGTSKLPTRSGNKSGHKRRKAITINDNPVCRPSEVRGRTSFYLSDFDEVQKPKQTPSQMCANIKPYPDKLSIIRSAGWKKLHQFPIG